MDLSVFQNQLTSGVLYPAPAYANGAAIQTTVAPLFEAYFTGARTADVFADMASKSQQLLKG